jgi:hypothetical protein
MIGSHVARGAQSPSIFVPTRDTGPQCSGRARPKTNQTKIKNWGSQIVSVNERESWAVVVAHGQVVVSTNLQSCLDNVCGECECLSHSRCHARHEKHVNFVHPALPRWV